MKDIIVEFRNFFRTNSIRAVFASFAIFSFISCVLCTLTCAADEKPSQSVDPSGKSDVSSNNIPISTTKENQRGHENNLQSTKKPSNAANSPAIIPSVSRAPVLKDDQCDQMCKDKMDGEASEKAYSLWPKNVRRYCSFDRAVQETVREMKTIPGILKAGYGPKNIYFSVESVYGNVISFDDWRDIKPNSDCIK